MLRIFLIYLILITSLLAEARSTYRRKLSTRSTFDFSFGQRSLGDIKIGGGETQTAAPITDVEIGIRVLKLYSTFLILEYSKDQQINYTFSRIKGGGLGFRAGLPGFFLLFANDNEVQRRSKVYPFNTYGYVLANVLSYTYEDETVTDLATEWGGGIDAFLYSSDLYLNFTFGITNLGGNSFLLQRFGLGWEF